MLTSLRIQNFKSWRDTGEVRLAPLTVIFGANSAGKSSLGHLLLALKQTALSSDRKRALNLGDDTTLIDLGGFADCLHGHDLNAMLSFELGWRLPGRLEVAETLDRKRRFAGDGLNLSATLGAEPRTQQPRTERVAYQLRKGDETIFSVEIAKSTRGEFSINDEPHILKKNKGKRGPMREPEKFYRLSEYDTARYQNAGFMADFALATDAMLRSIIYLGPLRAHPKRMYQWSGEAPESVGQMGEFTIAAILAAQGDRRKLNRAKNQSLKQFDEFIAEWLTDIGIIYGFEVKSVADGRREYEVLLQTQPGAPVVKLTDVGFGVSQVLPALVQAFYAPPDSTVWMEQPEIHLHPKVQAELADVFITATQAYQNGRSRNAQLIVESHSEHFLNRLQRRVAEGKISADKVAIYFAKRAAGATELEPLRLNRYGEIENWPDNFFGDEMADLTARTVAAAERRQHERP